MAKNVPLYGELLQCPYEKAHLIRPERMQVHLIKCEKQHPKANVKKCLFNFTHHIRSEEYAEHLRSCPDRRLVECYSTSTAIDAQREQAARQQYQQADPDVSNQEMSSVWDEDNWDDMDEKPYKPADYCLKNDVIRSARNLTKSEKRQFYENESIRRAELKKKVLVDTHTVSK